MFLPSGPTHFSTWTHRGVTAGNVEGGERVAHFLRIGRGGPLQCIGDHERLRDESAGILEQKLAVLLLILGIHRLSVGVDVVIPMGDPQQALRGIPYVLVEIGNNEASGAAVDGKLQAVLPDGADDQNKIV